MKKFIYFLLILLLSVFLTSCLFEDRQPPVVKEASINTPYPTKAGDSININVIAEDNNNLSKIELYGNSANPFYSKNLNNNYIEETISYYAPYSKEIYEIKLKIIDDNGNAAIKTLPKKLRTNDESKPTVDGFNLEKSDNTRNSNNYLLKSTITDIGSGLQSVTVKIDNGQAVPVEIIKSDNPSGEKYFNIIEETGYSVTGELHFLVKNIGLGTKTFTIEALDNSGKRTVFTRNKVLTPDGDPTFPSINVIYPPYVEPGEDYNITLEASDTVGYIEEFRLNQATYPIYPVQQESQKTVQFTAPYEQGSVQFTATTRNVFGNEASKSFQINIRSNLPPTIDLFQPSTIHPDPEANEIVNFKIRTSDDIGLNIVRIYLSGTNLKLAEYGSDSFSNGGRVLETEYNWEAIEGLNKIRIEAEDLHGKKTSKTVEIQSIDRSAPTLESLKVIAYVGGDSNKKRIIDTYPNFDIAQGDQIILEAVLREEESAARSAVFKSNDVDLNELSGRLIRISSDRRLYTFQTLTSNVIDRGLSVPYDININATFSNSDDEARPDGVETYTDIAKLKVNPNIDEIYRPKINLTASEVKTGVYNDINLSAEYEDDGKITQASLEVFKLNDNNTRIEFEGRPDITQIFNKPKGIINTEWMPEESGNYLLVASAINDLNLSKEATMLLQISGMAINLEKPNGEILTIRKSDQPLDFEFYTMLGTSGTMTVNYDYNRNKVYDETPTAIYKLFSNEATDLSYDETIYYNSLQPDTIFYDKFKSSANRYKGSITTMDTKIFPSPGDYRVKAEITHPTNPSETISAIGDFYVRDGQPPKIENITFSSSPVSYSGFDLPTIDTENFGENIYVPMEFNEDEESINNIQVNVSVSDDGTMNINNPITAFYDGVSLSQFTKTSIDTTGDIPAFNYTAIILKDSIDKEKNNFYIEARDNANPNPSITEKNLNITAIELNKPTIDNYEIDLISQTTDFTVSLESDNLETKTIPAGMSFDLQLRALSLTDDTAIGRFIIKLIDDQGNFVANSGGANWESAYDRNNITITNFNDTFAAINGPTTQLKTPTTPGNYKLVLEVQDKWKVETEGTDLEKYTEKYNRNTDTENKNIVDFVKLNVVDMVPPAVTLSIDSANSINDMPIINGSFQLNMNIQDKYDTIDKNSIKVFLKNRSFNEQNKTIVPLTNDNISGSDGSYITNVSGIDQNSIPDGLAEIWVEFSTLNSQVTVSYENGNISPMNLIIDKSKPVISNVRVYPSDPNNPDLGQVLTAEVGPQNIDVKEINFEIYDGNTLVSTLKGNYVGISQDGYPKYSVNVTDLPAAEGGNAKEYSAKVLVEDYAGNKSSSSGNTFTIERISPQVIPWRSSGRNKNKLAYNSLNFSTIQFRVEDNTALSNLAVGIDTSGNYNNPDYNVNKSYSDINNSTKFFTLSDIGLGSSSPTEPGAYTESDIDSNKYYTLNIYSVDENANSSVYKGRLYKDTTPPDNVVIKTSNIISENNYNANPIHIEVQDNVGVNSVFIESLSNGVEELFTERTAMFEYGEVLYWTYNYTPKLGVEGDFELVVTAEDLAVNTLNNHNAGNIQIDTKAPVINNFSLDATLVNNKYYTNDDTTEFLINVYDYFYKNITILRDTFTLYSDPSTPVSLSDLNNYSDLFKPNTENEFNLILNAYDDVGHRKESSVLVLVWDDVAPTVSLSNIGDTSSTNGNNIDITATFNETYLDPGSISVTFNSSSIGFTRTGNSIEFAIIDPASPQILKITASDYAGNTLTFTQTIQ
jgi:hypothetical protein